jgi:uncharacterized membrane protein YkvA (DUF1232 family)
MPRSRSRRRSRGAATGATLGRALSLAAFLPLASRAPEYVRLILALLADPRIPVRRKAVLALGGGYLLVGRDLIPDRIPVVGGLDDIIVVLLSVQLFLDGVPPEIVGEKLDELGIDPDAFHRDIDQLRRFTPRPIRRAMREVPRLIDTAAELAAQAGVGPRLRAWISREGSLA